MNVRNFELDHLENDHDAFTLANDRDHGSPGIALDTNTRSCRPAFRAVDNKCRTYLNFEEAVEEIAFRTMDG